ncbi:hypothetical protein REPUB_Repub05bG0103700 [Reevesia pubescens]
MRHLDDEKEMSMFALAIYGIVIFPKIEGYIEVRVVDFMAQVERDCNPASTILAKTFMSLSYCRRKEGSFLECSALLYVWLKSHFKCKQSVFFLSYSHDHAPI